MHYSKPETQTISLWTFYCTALYGGEEEADGGSRGGKGGQWGLERGQVAWNGSEENNPQSPVQPLVALSAEGLSSTETSNEWSDVLPV